MLIPYEQLSAAALDNLIEEFVTRDGTDYGAEEASLPQKISQVLRLLRQGEVVILFDDESASCNIIPRHKLPQYGLTPHDEH